MCSTSSTMRQGPPPRSSSTRAGFTVLGGRGVYPVFDDALEVTARSADDGQVAGSVVNNLLVDLHEVAVFADQAGMNIGTVPAGATVEFGYRGQVANPFEGEPGEFRVWRGAMPPGFFGEGGREHDPGPVNLGLWRELTAQWSLNARQVGQVVVAGWTDEIASPLDAEVTAGRTLLVTRGAIEPEGDSLSDLAVPREIVRGAQDLNTDFRIFEGWGGSAMFRFVLPKDASSGDLVLAVPRSQQRVELWTGADWSQVDLAGNTRAVLLLPPESIGSGRVYVKILFDFERGFPALRELAVRSPQGDDELSTLSYVADAPLPSESTPSDFAESAQAVGTRAGVAG